MAYSEKPTNIKGFTIIEVIMVIVIVGVLVGVSMPRFNSFYAMKLNGAMKKMVSDIRYTQNLAISTHDTYSVIFDTTGNSYEVRRVSDNSFAVDPLDRGNLSVNFNTHPRYQGIDIVSAAIGGTSTLRFTWEGVPQNSSGSNLSAEGTINLSYQGNSGIIYVTPDTGRVRVE